MDKEQKELITSSKKTILNYIIIGILGAGILAGVTKEVYDKSKGGQFNSFDLGATAFGSALSTMVFTVRLDFYYKKQSKQKINYLDLSK